MHKGLYSLFWLVFEKIIQLGMSILTVGLIARTLSPKIFGEFQYVLATQFIFSSFALIAGSELVAPWLARTIEQKNRKILLGSVFCLRLLTGIVAYTFLIIWSLCYEPFPINMYLLILGITIVVVEPFNVLRLTQEVFQTTSIITKIRLITSIVKLILILIIIFSLNKGNILVFIIIYALEFILVIAFYLYFIHDDGYPFQWKIDKHLMLKLFKKGGMIWLGLIFMVLSLRMDRIFMNKSLSPDLYGQYTVAMGLFDAMWAFGPVIISALAPSFVYISNEKIAFYKFICIVTLLGIFSSLAIYLIAPFAIPLIYGNHYHDSITILQLVIFVIVLGFASLSVDAILIRFSLYHYVSLKWAICFSIEFFILNLNMSLSWEKTPLALAIGFLSSIIIGVIALKGREEINENC